MLDIKAIRKNKEFFRKNLEKRNNPNYLEMFDNLVEIDKKWREIVFDINELRKEKNKLNLEISKMKKEGKDFKNLLIKTMEISEKIESFEKEREELEKEREFLLFQIPNLLHESVPLGKSENENVEIRRFGKKPKFDFEPKDHFEILKNLGMIDAEKAAFASGHGFFYLKGKAVILDLAIQRFALDFLGKKGFKIVEPPFMLRKEALMGAIDYEFFKDQIYKIENEDLHLIGTAEHSLLAMYANHVFNKDDLPLALAGISPCFRKEVGAHGKFTKGLFRMHQFNKVEQFVFCLPEQSWEWHEKLQENSEQLYKKLGIHFRTVVLCSSETGKISSKTYDIEVWMADGKFREAGSNSNCLDYQARRLNIKWRIPGNPPSGFVHTLNNTALATSRTMIAIIEQFQKKDGTVKIPRALWKYCGFKKLEKEE